MAHISRSETWGTNMIHIGFTGTQAGMSLKQKESFRFRVWKFYQDEMHACSVVGARNMTFHHGDCIGADENAHRIIENSSDLESICSEIVLHIPRVDLKRAFMDRDRRLDSKIKITVRDPLDYLVRNKVIVDESEVLFACPYTPNQEVRSGTWSTVRYARKKGKTVMLIKPDGSVKKLESGRWIKPQRSLF